MAGLLLIMFIDFVFMIRLSEVASFEAMVIFTQTYSTLTFFLKAWLVFVGLTGLYGWSSES